jgi:glycosyltransferase involved in cell wall biosynthesis
MYLSDCNFPGNFMDTKNNRNQIANEECKLSILMPCLNEAETLETCILKARDFLKKSNMRGEIIIADNGSADGSIELAKKINTRVVHVTEKGYGNALLGGIETAHGKFVIMGNADNSYDFSAQFAIWDWVE